jgi:hypothetical protein
MLNWTQLLTDLRSDNVDKAWAAVERITATVTTSELHHIYALAEDEDYFVRVMAGEMLVRTAGIAALPTLLRIMLRNEAEGFDNDGLDGATGDLITANPITARPILEKLKASDVPQEQEIGIWGLEHIPPHPPSLTVAPPPRLAWQRSCLTRIVVILVGVAVVVASWAYVPPLATAADCTAGRHAAWMSVDWTSQPLDPAALRTFQSNSSRPFHTLYPYISYLKQDGTFNTTYDHAAPFVDAFDAEAPDTLMLAWVGIPLRPKNGIGVQGWVELSRPETRRMIVEFVERVVQENEFDGVHLNVETVWNEDAAFLQLLDEVKAALGDNKVVSVAGSHWAPPVTEVAGIRWSSAYYGQVAARADQIATMTYDSRSLHPAIYRLWMREQVKGIAAAVAPHDSELLIGVSVSDEATATHAPLAESLADGLAGLCAANMANVAGVALYASWESSAAEWELWQNWIE